MFYIDIDQKSITIRSFIVLLPRPSRGTRVKTFFSIEDTFSDHCQEEKAAKREVREVRGWAWGGRGVTRGKKSPPSPLLRPQRPLRASAPTRTPSAILLCRALGASGTVYHLAPPAMGGRGAPGPDGTQCQSGVLRAQHTFSLNPGGTDS